MVGRLEGKKALISAAGQGIGRSTLLAFAREGAQVLATDLNPDSLYLLKKEFLESTTNIKTCVLDVNNLQAIQQLAEVTGAVDVLLIAPELCIMDQYWTVRKTPEFFPSISMCVRCTA